MLQVDLATQMSPYTVQSLQQTKEECENCRSQVMSVAENREVEIQLASQNDDNSEN